MQEPSVQVRDSCGACPVEARAGYRLATSDTDTPGRKLSVAIQARSASLRCLRPVGPSRTSRCKTRPADETSNWASILPFKVMSRNPIQNWIRFSHAQNGLARMGSASRLHKFAGWYRASGFTGASSHSGRRTAITNWARRISTVGGSLRDVQILARHSALSTTQRYIEADAGAMRRVVDFI